MNNNLSTQALVHKTKDELWAMIREAYEFAVEENNEDAEYMALEQIVAVSYVLKNCDYEGRE